MNRPPLVFLGLFIFVGALAAEPLSTRHDTAGMILHFSEGSGNTTVNSVNGNGGSITSLSWVTGKIGPGIQNTQNNTARIQLANPYGHSTTAVSAMAWIKPYAITNAEYDVILKPYRATTWSSPYLLYDLRYNGNAVSAYVYTSGGNFSCSANYTFVKYRWYHLALTWKENDPIRIYVDGALVCQSGATSGTLNSGANSAITIGSIFQANCCGFYGVIDEVGIYPRQMAAGEIKANYKRGVGTNYGD